MRRPAPRKRPGAARRVERAPVVAQPIRFGTSGWRGAFGEEVTAPRLRVLVRSIADWLRTQSSEGPVLIGFDRRFASESLATMAAATLREAGFEAILSDQSIPTPAMTHRLARGGYAAGLVLTASHNPAQDHGLKVFGARGGTILDASAREIEAIAAGRMQEDAPPNHVDGLQSIDLVESYVAALHEQLEHDALRSAGVTVVYDAMHGSGAGVLDRVLSEAGASVLALNADVDPQFGGRAPDPSPKALAPLASRLLAIRVEDPTAFVLGLATDGDGDRFGVVDGTGRILTETQVVGLLVHALAESGTIHRGVALTLGTGSFVERIAKHHGLAVERHPVGFKYLSDALIAERADVAGEESGGFALAEMGYDKDGILAGVLLANLVAVSGEGLETHLDRLETQFGPSACGRRSLPETPNRARALTRLVSDTPNRVVECEIVRDESGTGAEGGNSGRGLRWILEDGGFLMIRRSGTESAIRIYAEAASSPALEKRLDWAVARLNEDS